MALFRHATVRGTRAALRHWRLLLPLYLAGLGLGLLQTWPLLAAGADALRNPFLGELADGSAGLDLWIANPSSVGFATGAWALLALLASALFSLAYNFFSGGILAAYTIDSTASARTVGAPTEGPLLQFWWACRRWFWSFTGLGLLIVVLALIGVAVAVSVGVALGGWAGAIVGALLLELVNTLGEYARALGVARDRRNPFALLDMAAGFVRRHFVGVLTLALLGLLLHMALVAAYGPVARAFGGWPAVILWQQLAVLGWLWVKLLRLAWAASYVRAAGAEQAAANVALPTAA